MGCDIHIRAELCVDGEWRPAGRVFDSENDRGPYEPATRELLESLSDGQLLDALAWEGRSLDQVKADRQQRLEQATNRGVSIDDARPFDPERDDYHGAFREALGRDARRAFAEHNDRLHNDRLVERAIQDEWRAELARWREENPAQAAESEGYIGDDHPLAFRQRVKPRVQRITRHRRARVKLALAVREEIIRVAEAYRPWGDDEDDSDAGRLDISFERAEDEPPHKVSAPWDGRNYDLFAMLADVRNGRGFGGVPTGEGFQPIADPRGIPDDAHPATKAYLESYGVDGHSHSWHTLRQLREYDWDGQSTVRYGVVSAEVYERCIADDRPPTMWCGGISGAGIVTFTPEGYESWKRRGRPAIEPQRHLFEPPRVGGVVEAPAHAGETKAHVRMEWRVSYRAAAGEPWFRTIDQLAAIVPEGGSDDDVRVVFFFDN